MCIRDRIYAPIIEQTAISFETVVPTTSEFAARMEKIMLNYCLLYTSDAADERSSVDLGGRRIIKKKNIIRIGGGRNRTALNSMK